MDRKWCDEGDCYLYECPWMEDFCEPNEMEPSLVTGGGHCEDCGKTYFFTRSRPEPKDKILCSKLWADDD